MSTPASVDRLRTFVQPGRARQQTQPPQPQPQDKQVLHSLENCVFCIQILNRTHVTAALVKLDSIPDLVERVYRLLHDAISAGTLEPLARITQKEFARQLAVSRQPVLQAPRRIKDDSLVQDAPGRGLQVAPLKAALIASVYGVRGALDASAASLAALRQVVLDPLIERSAQLHCNYIRRAMGAVLQKSTLRESVWDEHEMIAQAIAAGDAAAAERLMLAHDRRAAEHMTRQLAAAANPPPPPRLATGD